MTYTLNPTAAQSASSPIASPAKVIKKVTDEQRSGRVTVIDPSDPSIGWRVYFGNGQVHFAQSIEGQMERLNYLIGQHFPQLNQLKSPHIDSDYDWICECWQSHRLPLNLVRQVLSVLTSEALVHLLAMPQAQVDYSSSIGLDPLLLSVPFRQLILPLREDINQWVVLQTSVKSPFQRYTIRQPEDFQSWVQRTAPDHFSPQVLVPLLEQEQCLYEMAMQLNLRIEDLAKALETLLSNGIVGALPYRAIQPTLKPVIACVDDSRTIQQFVKLALEPSGYEVVSLLDPSEALQELVNHQPELILMDIEMPKIDGYELCKMVRQIESLRKTPVVMLTGREGLFDRVRAKMLGCSAYLTKPFNPAEMVALVQKLTHTAPTQA
ncbi:response regulator [Lyngbya confervoides]|uniref:Protein PatA n=1 Tax=Lyngbya confervoides BDU141951 TaxID=1574623 RepID=A0ABD4T247_9CYAN|nr:response regulator [Lyngbya confervoides]MCM1982664.1 response regulator [Lyngbya confervoides BDU141951]